MDKFIKILSRSHFVNKNIFVYENETGYIAKAEDMNGSILAKKQFETLLDLEEWYFQFEGTGITQLSNALDEMLDYRREEI